MEGLVRVPVREQEPKVRILRKYVMDTTRKRQLQRLPVA